MGRHDDTAHYLHMPKQVKFKQLRPPSPFPSNKLPMTPRTQKLGSLNRRG
jgi:hypothetical protein